jgi:hypothetical protein
MLQESKDAASRVRTSTLSGELRSSHCQSRKTVSPRWMTPQGVLSLSLGPLKKNKELLTGLYTKNFWHAKKHIHRRFYTKKLVHRETVTQSDFIYRRFYAQKFSHRETFEHKAFTYEICTHRCLYTQKLFYAEQPLHRETFTNGHKETLTHRKSASQMLLHEEDFTEKLSRADAFTPNNCCTEISFQDTSCTYNIT